MGKRTRGSINHLEGLLAWLLVSETFRSCSDIGYIVILFFKPALLPAADFLVSKDCV